MEIEWKPAEYEIIVYCDGEFFKQEITGLVSGGFGIHETDFGFNVTELKTGWNCFTCESENGAQIIARYLIENYRAEFDRLKVEGARIENFNRLADLIKLDTRLKELRKLFAMSHRQMTAKNLYPKVKVEIVS